MPGMRRSSTTRSGLVCATSGRTFSPVLASPTTSNSAVVFERAFDPVEDQAVVIRDDDFQHDFSLYRSNEGFP